MGSVALLLLVCSSWLLPHSVAAAPKPPIRAVNLGGWLVTEGWIQGFSLFDGIRNNDLLCGWNPDPVEVGHAESVPCRGPGRRRRHPRRPGECVQLGDLQAVEDQRDDLQLQGERRTVLGRERHRRCRGDGHHAGAVGDIPNRAPCNRQEPDYIQRLGLRSPVPLSRETNKNKAKTMASVTADYGEYTDWSDNDPSVFVANLNNLTNLYGEYQLWNGYGIANATQVPKTHWSTFITEKDFSFMAANGLNAVRIPVGWWIASDPNPPPPFVGGSLQALDNAFAWAEKYNIGVIVDLHAAPGSQNPYEHSATRDGSQEWGTSDANIAQTVQGIEFLATRYTNRTGLLAIELLNEPLAPGTSLSSLMKYYRDGYNAVRRHTPTAYVIMSNRLNIANQSELLQFAGGFPGSVLDVHYYNLFNSMFDSFTVQQNIDYVRNNRSAEPAAITSKNGSPPLTFVGEWSAAWGVQGANATDYQRFAQIQQDVDGNATFGWAYWTLQNSNPVWNMTFMIQNGIITLKR